MTSASSGSVTFDGETIEGAPPLWCAAAAGHLEIVKLLTGEQSTDHPATLSAFALGFVLFMVTLVLNYIALRVVKRFREAYE